MSHQGVATTTYGYDAFGQRVLQTGTSTTTIYPFKWYSLASSTGTGAKYATTTSYVFNGDTLLATVDQQTASGVATGTAVTSFIHPDHLGSTNVVTNASGTVVQTLDYYPYGATRISVSAGANEARKYIGQFADQSNLDYLNARYYDGARGQFISEDPVFWAQQTLSDPQSFNTYSYAGDSPVVKRDPSGRCPMCIIPIAIGVGAVGGLAQQGISDVVANYTENGFNVQNYQWSSAKDYEYSALSGAVLGGAISTGGFLGAGALGIGFIAAGGTAGSDVIRSSYVDHTAIDPYAVGFDAVTAAFTAGLVEETPKIRGRTPNPFTQAYFTGSHSSNEVLKTTVGSVSGGLSMGTYSGASYYAKSGNGQGTAATGGGGYSGSGGGGGSSTLIGLYQSLVSTLTALVSALSASKH